MSADADRIGVATANLWADITREIHDFSSRPVGFGGYSDIYTAIWRSEYGDMKVAVKVIRAAPTPSKSGELPRALRREISVWKRLVHPNIHILCGFYDGFGSAPAFVSPWYENGDINEYTRQHAADPDIGLLKLKLFADVATGLKFLHENHIVHGDIKGGNVLISDDGVARLCDFGLSRLLLEHTQSMTNTGGKGTSRWMAPELLLIDGAHHSYETDIWAVGCLFIEVWSRVVPYHDKANNHQVILALSRAEPPSRPSDMPDAIWSIVRECCEFNATQRLAPGQVVAYISLRIITQRVSLMVALGRTITSPVSKTLREIEMGLRALEPPQLSKLCILAEADLAAEVIRIFGAWGLTTGLSSLFQRAVFQWCLSRLGTGNIQLPSGASLTDTNDDDFSNVSCRSHETAELRLIARLLERALPGVATDFLVQFSTAAIGPPFEIGTQLLSVAWFPDGSRIAVACNDSSIRILSTATAAILHRLVGHAERVMQVDVSPDGRLVGSCSEDKTIRLWDAKTGLAIAAPLVGHTGWVLSLAFSPDGQHIVSVSEDRTLSVWSVDACTPVLSWRDPWHGGYSCVAYSPDGSSIVTGCDAWYTRIWKWDARTGNGTLIVSRGHADSVRSVTYSPDGLRIVSASYDRTVRIWDAITGELIGSPLKGHSSWVQSAVYSPDGKHIASCSDDCTVRMWNSETGASIATFQGHTDFVYSVAFSPDGRRLASGSRDGTVRIWDATDEWTRWDM